MHALDQYLITIQQTEPDGRQRTKRTTRCPVCERQGTLHETKGMILCNYCFWALELRQVS